MAISPVLLIFWTILAFLCDGVQPVADRMAWQLSTPGCHMGSNFYDLHSTWTPNSEPQGPMHCMICKCMPVVKKGIVQSGKITCKNVKERCPNAEHCTSPLLTAGRCCRVCPGQEFIAVLTGSSMMMSSNTSAVGRGRFTLTSGELHYSIEVNGLDPSKVVQFVDEVGNVHQEDLDVNQEDMICGSWKDLSKTHVNYLQQQRIRVLISSKSGDSISGRILPHPAPNKEIFTAILSNDDHSGSGAVAMLDYDAKKKSLDFILLLRGIQLPMDTPSPISLELYKGKSRLSHTQVEILGDETQISGSWKNLQKKALKNLPRSRLKLLVTMVTGTLLQGTITARQTCNGFHTLLSGQLRRKKTSSGAAGFAKFHLRKGILSYQVQLTGLKSPINELLVTNQKKKRGKKKKHTCNIEIPVNVTQSLLQFTGSCGRLKAADVAKYYGGELVVMATTRAHPEGLLLGPLVEIFHHSKIPRKEFPVILSGSDLDLPEETFIAGRAYFVVDDLCVLHYDISIEGLDPTDLLLKVTLHATAKKASEEVVLENFGGSFAKGNITNLQRRMFAAFHKGAVMVIVRNKANPEGIIGGKVTLENNCHGSKGKGNFVDVRVLHDNAVLPTEELKKCSYEGVWYSDGDSWPRTLANNCGMCSCKRGLSECHDGVCPKVYCAHPLTLPGECCPQCIDHRPTDKCYYEGDQSYHNYGTIWHPYVPQLGYSTCAICKCGETGIDDVNCTRLNCPPLDCPLQEAVRINPNDCCQVCPDTPTTLAMLQSATLAPIKAVEMSLENDGSCSSHGMTYSNGQRFHPLVMPFGYLPCYTCLCQNGNIGCERTVCPELLCVKKIMITDVCCSRCAD